MLGANPFPRKSIFFPTYSEQNKAEEVDFSQYLRISRSWYQVAVTNWQSLAAWF